MLTIARSLHPRDVGQGHRLAAANRPAIAGVAQLVQEMQPAAGVSGIDENRLAAVDQRRQCARIVPVRDRGNHQHDEVGAANGFGDVGSHEVDGNEPLRDAARLDAALRAQRRETFRVARMQAHRVAALAEVGSGGASPVSGAENRNRIHCHFAFRVRNAMEGVTEGWIMGSMGRLSTKPVRRRHGSAGEMRRLRAFHLWPVRSSVVVSAAVRPAMPMRSRVRPSSR